MIFNCFCVTPFYCAHRTSLQQQEGKNQNNYMQLFLPSCHGTGIPAVALREL